MIQPIRYEACLHLTEDRMVEVVTYAWKPNPRKHDYQPCPYILEEGECPYEKCPYSGMPCADCGVVH